MATIKQVNFFFAIADENGFPEKHTHTFNEFKENIGITLSTGETLFTDFPDPLTHERFRLVNGFYFGSGKYGTILGIQIEYEDDSEAWISEIVSKDSDSVNIDMIVGKWIKEKKLEDIQKDSRYKGIPLIGYVDDFIDIKVKREPKEFMVDITPAAKTIVEEESVTFEITETYNEGTIASHSWSSASGYTKVTTNEKTATIKFSEAGIYSITYTAVNSLGQTDNTTSIITVTDRPLLPCNVSIGSTQDNFLKGEVFDVVATHTYSKSGSWDTPPGLSILGQTEKTIQLRGTTAGVYTINYVVNNGDQDCGASLTILIIEPSTGPGDPTIPQTPDVNKDPLFLGRSTHSDLYKYGQKEIRNARHRGPRESFKVLADDNEFVYDLHTLTEDVQQIEEDIWLMRRKWLNTDINTQNINLSSGALSIKDSQANGAHLMTAMGQGEINSAVIQLNEQSSPQINLEQTKQILAAIDQEIGDIKGRVKQFENANK